MTDNEVQRCAHAYYKSKLNVKGDGNNFGTIYGLDQKAVCEMLGDAVTRISKCIEKKGQQVDKVVVETLLGIIHDNMVCIVSELREGQKVSEESIKSTIQQNFGKLSKNTDEFVNGIIAELGENRKSILEAIQSMSAASAYAAQEAWQSVIAALWKMEHKLPDYAKELDVAWGCLRDADFEHALEFFNKATQQNDLKADAYFGMALAENRIQLIWDHVCNCEQPIFYKYNINFSHDSGHFKMALECTTDEQKERFINVENAVYKIFKEFCEYEKERKNYDCFICTKVTDENDCKTSDCKWLEDCDLYKRLQAAGIATFYSEKDCGEEVKKHGFQYEALILYALSKVKCMVIVCSKEEYLHTPWVKNEYTRFCRLLESRNQDKEQIIIIFDDCPIELPNGLRKGYQDISRAKYCEWDDKKKNEWFAHLIATVSQRVERGKGYVERYKQYCPVCGTSYIGEEIICNAHATCSGTKLVSDFEYANIMLAKEREKCAQMEKTDIEREAIAKENEKLTEELVVLQDKLKQSQHAVEIMMQNQNIVGGTRIFYVEDKILCSYDVNEIEIPYGVLAIDQYAFSDCEHLKSIEIPDSVTSIGANAFDSCDNLESITIPDSVTSIGANAFDNCESLESITIPDSVTSIGEGAFMDCCSLKSITVKGGNKKYHSSGNCLIETQSKVLILGCVNSVIPIDGSVTSIGANAFDSCDNLESIEIPDGVTSIGEGAFSGCSSLESIEIPDGVTSIGEGAFMDCSSLESIEIPDSVTSIGANAFNGCSSLKSITIPNSVTSIGRYAFFCCGGNDGIIVYCEASQKPNEWDDYFDYNCIVKYGTKKSVS